MGGTTKSKLSAGDDVGIAIGALVIALVITIVGLFIWHGRRSGGGQVTRTTVNPIYYAARSNNEIDGRLLADDDY